MICDINKSMYLCSVQMLFKSLSLFSITKCLSTIQYMIKAPPFPQRPTLSTNLGHNLGGAYTRDFTICKFYKNVRSNDY